MVACLFKANNKRDVPLLLGDEALELPRAPLPEPVALSGDVHIVLKPMFLQPSNGPSFAPKALLKNYALDLGNHLLLKREILSILLTLRGPSRGGRGLMRDAVIKRKYLLLVAIFFIGILFCSFYFLIRIIKCFEPCVHLTFIF